MFIEISFNRLKCFILPIPHMFIYYDLSVHVFAMITWQRCSGELRAMEKENIHYIRD